MYSVNVPVPGMVGRLAGNLARDLGSASVRPRGERTLVVKRLDDERFHSQVARAREALAGTPTFDVRVNGVDVFENPPEGPEPVVYLAVESPGLRRVHATLVDAFEALPGLEGEEYDPHVTIGRGCSDSRARDLTAREIDPIEWTVDELQFWNARRKRAAGTVSLPA